MKALTKTDFNFPGQKSVYHGKVRDVYNINGEKLVMVATDRISAFDVVLPEGIPYKGQMLNQIAAKFLDATTDICPNWKLATPDPMVTVGVLCEGFPVEMIGRGYLCGSAWRAYKSGVREICGVKLPDGMRENQKFPEPIVTPTTKAEMGLHDEDISNAEIMKPGLATPEEYEILEKYTLAPFKRGTEIAAERGLILVDTKYEFGKHNGTIYLMDEIHTPDYAIIMENGQIVEQGFVEDLKEKYILIKGDAADTEAAGKVLYSMTKNPYGFEGICLAENIDKLAGFNVTKEIPTLYQISVAVMKNNTKIVMR